MWNCWYFESMNRKTFSDGMLDWDILKFIWNIFLHYTPHLRRFFLDPGWQGVCVPFDTFVPGVDLAAIEAYRFPPRREPSIKPQRVHDALSAADRRTVLDMYFGLERMEFPDRMPTPSWLLEAQG
ncbi:hypothetical protein IAT38_006313 [Cryptococcus sp. DSM 104549]